MPAPRRRIRTLLERPGALLRLRRFGRLEDRAGAPIVYGNGVDVLGSGRAAFQAMAAAVDGAHRAIAVEMYTWSDDRLGRAIARALAERARAGVAVFVLLDAFGSFATSVVPDLLEESGAIVRWYHPLAPWTPSWYPNRRNHRKLLIADGKVALVGGLNIDERYSEEFAGDAAWRDLAVRVRGPAVFELVRAFMGSWLRAGGPAEAAGALAVAPREAGTAGVQVVPGRGVRGRRGLRRGYLGLLNDARDRIFVASAYFAPEGILLRSLARAARRGVDVDLLLPGPTDFPIVRWAGRACYERLLAAGVEIREHGGSILHAKIAVVDGSVLVAGSANLDYRSFRHNLEVAVNVFDDRTARAATESFAQAWEAATPVSLATWRRRGVRDRVLERLAWAARYWL